jgi:hypothetical protein
LPSLDISTNSRSCEATREENATADAVLHEPKLKGKLEISSLALLLLCFCFSMYAMPYSSTKHLNKIAKHTFLSFADLDFALIGLIQFSPGGV